MSESKPMTKCMTYYYKNREKMLEHQRIYDSKNKDKIKEKRAEYYKEYYKRNKEYFKQYNVKYVQDHKEKKAEYFKEYYKQNKEKLTAYNKQMYDTNREYFKEYYLKNKSYFKQKNFDRRNKIKNDISVKDYMIQSAIALKEDYKRDINCQLDLFEQEYLDFYT